ncbi:hypothetical protein [Methyloversatilis sp.]|uniref:DUF7210 family protein n=1 Tax=Methyloversatilis sp. TaxID=2569862 RepID=UPI003D2C1AB2
MAKKIEKANREPTRPFMVLREIKHNGKRYKEGDTIELTYDEAVEMFGDGRVSGDFPDQQEGDKKPEGDTKPEGGEGTGGAPEGTGGGEGGDGGQGDTSNPGA